MGWSALGIPPFVVTICLGQWLTWLSAHALPVCIFGPGLWSPEPRPAKPVFFQVEGLREPASSPEARVWFTSQTRQTRLCTDGDTEVGLSSLGLSNSRPISHLFPKENTYTCMFSKAPWIQPVYNWTSQPPLSPNLPPLLYFLLIESHLSPPSCSELDATFLLQASPKAPNPVAPPP